MAEKKETKQESKQSIYEKLSQINVKPYLNTIEGYTKKTHKYFKLSYLSWAKAWGLVKAIYPEARYDIKEYPNWVKCSDGTFQQAGTLDYRITSVGCEVQVTVTIEGQKFTQKLYPMDRSNSPILRPNIKDINKAQLRCLVKALATAGLGLNVYAGEDLPSTEDETAHRQNSRQAPKKASTKEAIKKIQESTAKKIANAKNFKIEYGASPEKLVDVVGWEEQGDSQAKLFLDNWRSKSKANNNAYLFIKKNGLAEQKASA